LVCYTILSGYTLYKVKVGSYQPMFGLIVLGYAYKSKALFILYRYIDYSVPVKMI